MMRRLRVLTVFVGVIWLAFGIIQAVYLAALTGALFAVTGIVVGVAFLTLSVLFHLELRHRKAHA